jgi:biotin carboxylase
MGDKIESKKVAKEAGVHVIPGNLINGMVWF